MTQVRVLLRAGDVLVVMVTFGAALMTFEPVRQFGVSLFASAGVAGIVAGFAARPVLSNLFAGVQLAMTQPIRIDDAVIVENEWGTIEEITSTYVVVRLWDWRRMIVPLSYFIEKPFQNWTREGSALIGSAMIYVDYRAPVGAIREKLNEIVKSSKNWDGKVVNLQVTDAKEQNHRAALPDERAQRLPGLRPALRGARKAHRVSAERSSRSAAAAAHGGRGVASSPKAKTAKAKARAQRRRGSACRARAVLLQACCAETMRLPAEFTANRSCRRARRALSGPPFPFANVKHARIRRHMRS